MNTTSTNGWKSKRTDETREVEKVLRKAGFKTVDSYRYNSASIRIRVIDKRFEGQPLEKRDAMVEPHLAKLSERTQADIMNLFTFAPSELSNDTKPPREFLLNEEFENPSPSVL